MGGARASKAFLQRQRSSASDAPSTALRAVPLPRFAGADKAIRSRDAFAPEFCRSISQLPERGGVERREAPGSWATPRGRMLPLARVSGVARATGRSACANRLLRARGASRRSTAAVAGAAGRPRLEPHSPHQSAVTGRRRSMGENSLSCTCNRDDCQGGRRCIGD